MSKSWIMKYQPGNANEIIGQDNAVEAIEKFFAGFPGKKRAAFFYGPSGCGKTSAAHAFAQQKNLEIFEINASDTRNKTQLEEKLCPAMQQQSLLFRKKIILIDEIDGLSNAKDRGGIPAVAKLIDGSPFPIILTANEPWDKKFSALRKKSTMVEFDSLDHADIVQVLEKICLKEKIEFQDSALRRLARHSGGDMRGSINDLQTLAVNGSLKDEDVDMLGYRDSRESVQNALTKIFKSKNAELTREVWDDVPEDINSIFLWLEENLPREYAKGCDRSDAFNAMSRADVFYGRIRRRQHWRFLVYVYALLGAGIAVSKEEKYPGLKNYGESRRPLKIWMANQKYGKRKSIAEKYAEASHTSSARALHAAIPYFKPLFDNEKIARALDLDDEEINWAKK